MRPLIKCLVPTLAAALTLAACGSSSSGSSQTSASTAAATTASQSGAAGAAVVKTASNANVGATVLTNASGMTLYTLSGERDGKLICTSTACLHVWHPVTVTAAVTPTGVSSLATVTRSDGTVQVTYKGQPLYTFAQDTAPGQDNGQGLKDVGTWSVVKVAGAAPSTPASSQSSSSEPASSSSETESSGSSGSSGGYAY
jgi:predicted lipoprotein with Yx(FWY)xxD motif